MVSKLPENEIKRFSESVHIFPLRCLVRDHNRNHLRKMFSSEKIIKILNGREPLEIAIGCRIMLTRNLGVNVGLTNGCQGIVLHVEYNDNCKESVKCIVGQFEDYSGNHFVTLPNGSKGFPIFRIADTEFNEAICKYVPDEKFQLVLCYATTAQKSQGLNLKMAAVFLDEHEFAPGLDFVVLSR
ncbi:unnamed protein product [Allacma fusca]|uniref:ATP-dependent DNA helicase n=1 Tax=Allacma fusca TaxID=39272 RepID=A0A8J2JUB5_9HEXA|nr:unnamed protein product [Allacma fusca]